MHVVVVLEPWLQDQRLLGETVTALWMRRLTGHGRRVTFGAPDAAGGDVVLDGSCLALGLDDVQAAARQVLRATDAHDAPIVAVPAALAHLLGRPATDHLATRAVAGPWGEPIRHPGQLNQAEQRLAQRVREALLGRVRVHGPSEGLTVSPSVAVDDSAELWGDVVLLGATRIGPGAVVHKGCHLVDTVVEAGAVLKPYTVAESAHIGPEVQVGPFAHLRPGTRLDAGAKIGNFVETKAAHLHAGAKANHLTYLGDCGIGAGTNVGAGTITCNYDGARKHRTTIGAGAFIGTHTALVAPVTVGDRALIAAGSVITEAVPDEALALGRARQRTIPDRGAEILDRNRQLKAAARRAHEDPQ